MPTLPNSLGLEDNQGMPAGVAFLHKAAKSSGSSSKEFLYRLSVLVLTFIAYTAYHASRKPLSIVKNSPGFLDCPTGKPCKSWVTQLDKEKEEDAHTVLGLLDTSYLVMYAVCMFASGFVAERVDLRLFLSAGMFLSGLTTLMFGLAKPLGVHSVWYFVTIQVLAGIVQTTAPFS